MINIKHNQDILKTFKFFTNKYEQLSIFGVHSNNRLLIYIIKCSTNDEFSKEKAYELFNEYMSYREGDEIAGCKPTIYEISATKETYRKQFIQFCRQNFFVKETTEIGMYNTNFKIVIDTYNNSKFNITKLDQKSLRISKLSKEQLKELKTNINGELPDFMQAIHSMMNPNLINNSN